MPVMKAIRIAAAGDLARTPAYEDAADQLLFDAKPPPNVAALWGGNGLPFDWSGLAGRRWWLPWMQSGGLDTGHLVAAVEATGATAVHVAYVCEHRLRHTTMSLLRHIQSHGAGPAEL